MSCTTQRTFGFRAEYDQFLILNVLFFVLVVVVLNCSDFFICKSVFFYVGGPAVDILPMDTVGRMHIMSVGVRVFVKNKRTGGPFPFRLASEAVSLLSLSMKKRLAICDIEDAKKLVAKDSVLLTDLSEKCRAQLAGMDQGSFLWKLSMPDGNQIPILGWLASNSAQFQIPKENKGFISSLVNTTY